MKRIIYYLLTLICTRFHSDKEIEIANQIIYHSTDRTSFFFLESKKYAGMCKISNQEIRNLYGCGEQTIKEIKYAVVFNFQSEVAKNQKNIQMPRSYIVLVCTP